MTPLERHGIDHLSAGSLNLWIANPREWALRYLAGEREEADAGMWRGSAIEAGLARVLRGASPQEARTAALDSFELNALGDLSEEVEAERKLLIPMIDRAATWAAPGDLVATQLRIEYRFEEIPVPLVGYLDFAFLTGIDVDLKTGRVCPSHPRGHHVRQVALYRAARKRRGGLLYVTCKRLAYFEIDDQAAGTALDDLRDGALSLVQFLDKVWDAEEALACLPYNPDDFRTTPKLKEPIGSDVLTG
jgi:hypothetical protein